MKKFKIIQINDDEYSLEDNEKEKYKIYLELFDVKSLPKVGEYICFSEKLLDVEANEGVRFFSFGGLSEVYGKDIKDGEVDESFEELLIIIKNDNTRIFLKRFYG